MDYDQFIYAITQCIENELYESESVEKQEVLKNNGVVFKGITIKKKGEKIAPVIYLQDYYERFQSGDSLEDLAQELIELSRKLPFVPRWNYGDVLDFPKMKSKIVYRLINAKENEELLKDIPSLPILDLAIVFYIIVDSRENERCSIMVKNSHLAYWNVSVGEVYECAKHNTPRLFPYTLMPVDAFAKYFAGETLEKSPLLVLSNLRGMNGAAVLLYYRMPERIYQYVGGNYYLIPSSIHEFIIVPWEPFLSAEDLKLMVKDVNAHHIAKEEILSDHIYYFDGNNITIL